MVSKSDSSSASSDPCQKWGLSLTSGWSRAYSFM